MKKNETNFGRRLIFLFRVNFVVIVHTPLYPPSPPPPPPSFPPPSQFPSFSSSSPKTSLKVVVSSVAALYTRSRKEDKERIRGKCLKEVVKEGQGRGLSLGRPVASKDVQ